MNDTKKPVICQILHKIHDVKIQTRWKNNLTSSVIFFFSSHHTTTESSHFGARRETPCFAAPRSAFLVVLIREKKKININITQSMDYGRY